MQISPALRARLTSTSAQPSQPAMEGSKLTTPDLTDPRLSRGQWTGLSFANETEVPILVVLSQITPLHWARVDPGQTVHLPSGRVWFTISAVLLDEHTVIPTRVGVAARFAGMAAAAAVAPVLGFYGAMISNSISVARRTSPTRSGVKPCQAVGILANGRCIVVRSSPIEGGEHQLRFVVPAAADGEEATPL